MGLIYTNGYEINYIFNSKTYNSEKDNFHSKANENRKNIKIDKDIDELTETVDWMDEASEIQSHFYHEFLFSTIGMLKLKINKNNLFKY